MVIAVVGRKGGIGKTTTAVNLASALAARGKRVLLVDLDSQCSASLSLGVGRAGLAPSIADVLLRNEPLEAVIRPSGRTPAFDLVTASVDLISYDESMANTRSRETLLRSKLEPVRQRYDHIVLDCPPALSLIPINALVACDGFIVPAVPQFLAVEGIQNLLAAVDRLAYRTQTRPRLLGVLLTLVDYRIKTTTEIVGQLRAELGEKVFATEVRINTRLAEAPRYGFTVFEYDPTCRGADAYTRLASELLDGRPTDLGLQTSFAGLELGNSLPS